MTYQVPAGSLMTTRPVIFGPQPPSRRCSPQCATRTSPPPSFTVTSPRAHPRRPRPANTWAWSHSARAGAAAGPARHDSRPRHRSRGPQRVSRKVTRLLILQTLTVLPSSAGTGHHGAVSVDDVLDRLLPEDWRDFDDGVTDHMVARASMADHLSSPAPEAPRVLPSPELRRRMTAGHSPRLPHALGSPRFVLYATIFVVLVCTNLVLAGIVGILGPYPHSSEPRILNPDLVLRPLIMLAQNHQNLDRVVSQTGPPARGRSLADTGTILLDRRPAPNSPGRRHARLRSNYARRTRELLRARVAADAARRSDTTTRMVLPGHGRAFSGRLPRMRCRLVE